MSVESSGGNVTTYENGAFIQQTHYEGVDGYYLAFREKTAEEIKMENDAVSDRLSQYDDWNEI